MGVALPTALLTTALLAGFGTGMGIGAGLAQAAAAAEAETRVANVSEAAPTPDTAPTAPDVTTTDSPTAAAPPMPEAVASVDAESTPATRPPAAPAPVAAAPEAVPSPAPTGMPVYLTFDDGPDPHITPQVLDVLAAHDATATFFVQGSQVQAYPELTRRIAHEGHSVQNHAWSHPRLTELGTGEVINSQLLPTNEVIASTTGIAPSCLRAPYGATSAAVASAAGSVGLDVVHWHINPADYNDPGSEQIAGHVLNNLTPGSIVLLHDAGSGDRQQTVDALATLLPEMAARGFQPQALCQ